MNARTIPSRPGIYIEKSGDWDEHGWTSTPNAMAADPTLDWDAKGAYTWLARHEQLRYRITPQDLAAAGPNGLNHAYGLLRKLEEKGWLTRHEERNPETGQYNIHIYRLHPAPVSPEERTFRPSKAKKRTGSFTKKSGETPSSDPLPARAGSGENPALEDAGESARETPSSDPLPARAGSGDRVPARAVPARAGTPYMEDKTTGENQGGGPRGVRHLSPGTQASDDPLPPSELLWWQDPQRWHCREHLELLAEESGADIPPCNRCRRVKDQARPRFEAWRIEVATSDAERDRVTRLAAIEAERAERAERAAAARAALDGPGHREFRRALADLAERRRRAASERAAAREAELAATL